MYNYFTMSKLFNVIADTSVPVFWHTVYYIERYNLSTTHLSINK